MSKNKYQRNATPVEVKLETSETPVVENEVSTEPEVEIEAPIPPVIEEAKIDEEVKAEIEVKPEEIPSETPTPVEIEVKAEEVKPEVKAETSVEPPKETFKSVRAGTLRDKAVRVMIAHRNEPMEKVLPLIAQAIDGKLPKARSFYTYLVKYGMAPGVIPSKVVVIPAKVEEKKETVAA